MQNKVTYKNLFQLVEKEISKRVTFNTTSSFQDQLNRTLISPITSDGRSDASAGELVTGIQNLLTEALPAWIISGLTVEATDPISSSVTVSPGKGAVGGFLYELDDTITLGIPFDSYTELFYITLYKDNIFVDKTLNPNRLTIAKIVVPNPGITNAIQNDKDESWNAYIVNFKEFKLYGYNDKFEEDTIELLRDNISPILADNLIGNIRLSEDLKITNTQGTLELNSNSLKLFDVSDNLLAKFNQNGTYFYDVNGVEMARFTNIDARIGNIKITTNSIQSNNFVDGSQGFRIKDDGDVQFSDGTFRGTLYASGGTIGGWDIDSTKIYKSNSHLSSSGYISFGSTPPTSYGNNLGTWLGYSGGAKLSLYSNVSNYLQWDGSNLTIKGSNFELNSSGNITASGGTIGGFTINSTKLYGGIIQTGLNVAAGEDGVRLDSTGLKGYNSTLGLVFNLPTDGSAPTFSSGTIQNTIFEINTNAVLRTSESVGDGTSASAGILINNTGMYGCGANQSLASANLKALIDGTIYLKGEITATSGTIGSVTITPTSLIGGTISGSAISAATIETSGSYPKVRIDSNGLYYQISATIGKYGPSGSGSYGFKYGDGTNYGSSVGAYLFKPDIPFLTITGEQNEADIRLFNRSTNPISGSHKLGDLICVNGSIKRCSTAGNPGTFTSIGDVTKYVTTFTNSDLSSGILTVTHNLNTNTVITAIKNDTEEEIIPDSIDEASGGNSVSIDLSSYGTILGTWEAIIIG